MIRFSEKLRRKITASKTAREALPGAASRDFTSFSAAFLERSPVDELTSRRLLRVYGTRAQQLLDLAQGDSELLEPLTSNSHALRAEVMMSFQHEMAETLADCLLRRTMIGMNHSAEFGADRAVAEVAQKYLGWSSARAAQEITDYQKYRERFHPQKIRESASV
ncbi:MAG: glycerol-3-phosphate dehydrogenase C-terminal domain-containing protein [Pyrinomonadaceae bacterium]